jgi:Ser/Thr protein kinase RdoA (MazF antagonist)
MGNLYTPGPEEVAFAFGLGTPVGGLVHIRRGDSDVWRLDTVAGRCFVKGYIGGDIEQLTVAMAFERRAYDAGVDMPVPVAPVDPAVGCVTRIGDRLFRAYRWVESTTVERNVSSWLGRTMARVHQLEPVESVGLPEWWRQAVHSPATWEKWFASAHGRGYSWADQSVLPHIHATTERIADVCDRAPDVVMTHGDMKPHNVVGSAAGPVLVDWDSVRADSAALEAGRVAYIFGAGDSGPTGRILEAYVAAGGELDWVGPDLLLGVARNHIQVLSELIRVALDESPPARWMGDRATIASTIENNLRALPTKLDVLRTLTSTAARLTGS